tara:strand:- start:40 stop:780 length:741 start_codon:yes stop_codon:yes gene_type:complete
MAKEIYKNVGETTGDLSNRIKKTYNCTKVAICGKLDPMARGITKYLVDGDTKLMQNYLNNVKTYEFNLVLGLKTDTDDIMGIVSELDDTRYDFNSINAILQSMMTETKQHFHPFSAIKCRIGNERKSLHQWTLEGKCDHKSLPEKQVTVYNMDIGYPVEINIKDYILSIKNRLSLVNDTNCKVFRINDIINSWNNILYNTDNQKKIVTIKLKMQVSSGYYIRMISYYLYYRYKINSHIFDIHRTET